MGDAGGSSSWDPNGQNGQQAPYGTLGPSSSGEAQATATQAPAPYYTTPTSVYQSISTSAVTYPSAIASTPLSQTSSPFPTSSASTFSTSLLSRTTSSSPTSSPSTLTSSPASSTSTLVSSALGQTTSPSPTSSPSTSSTGLSSSQRTAIIGGIFGGVGGILIISVLAIYCLQRRKGRKQGEKGPAEPSTYSQVNDSFAGVSFVKNNSHFSTPQYSVMSDTSYQGAGQYMHDGQPTHFNVSHDAAMETDQFLPAYEQLPTPHPLHLVSTTGANSFSPSDPFASRPTTRDPFTDQNRLSQHTMTISEPNTPIRPLLRHDTMGFPLDDEDTSYLAQSQSQPQFPAPFPLEPLSPPPTRPLPLPPFQFPAPQRTYTNTSTHSRPSTASLSRTSSISSNATFTPAFVQLLNRQSQSLSQSQPLSQSPPQSPPPATTHLHLHRQQTNTSEYEYGDIVSPLSIQGNWGGFGNVGLSRNTSQRTQSSFAPSVISETELERLGVGMRF
ncbi:hypothetical protein CJF31_00008426 [Rutstroemia sp. NJR-2017a BVV2]|nr:hypothetical protein CJF31_00008426 [Rutstroemia sp. NJR-2017a BVV2]